MDWDACCDGCKRSVHLIYSNGAKPVFGHGSNDEFGRTTAALFCDLREGHVGGEWGEATCRGPVVVRTEPDDQNYEPWERDKATEKWVRA